MTYFEENQYFVLAVGTTAAECAAGARKDQTSAKKQERRIEDCKFVLRNSVDLSLHHFIFYEHTVYIFALD